MKQKITLLVLAVLCVITLVACGSSSSSGGDGNRVPYTGRVDITCADVVGGLSEQCNGTLETEGGFAGGLKAEYAIGDYSSIYSAGDVATDATIMYALEAENGTNEPVRVYLQFDTRYTVSGCNGGTGYTYPFDVPALTLVSLGQTGDNYYACAEPGPSYMTISIYNASHLAPGDDQEWPGDPANDEVLSRSILRWNFVNGT